MLIFMETLVSRATGFTVVSLLLCASMYMYRELCIGSSCYLYNNIAEAAFPHDHRPPASPGSDAADERLTRSITDVLDMFLQLQPQVTNGNILPVPQTQMACA